MNASIFRVALALGASAIALSPAVASNSWGGYHWARVSNTKALPLFVNTAITSDWNTAVGASVLDWNSSTGGSGGTLGSKPSGTSPILALSQRSTTGVSAKQCSPISGQILVCNAGYGQRGWLGIASIWLNGSHITQATTKLNDTYFNMAQYNSPEWRAMVACQEIGHDFGLDHQDTTFLNVNLGSCMDYTNSPGGGPYNGFEYGPSNVYPNQHDYTELGSIYGHADGFTTSSSPAATSAGMSNGGKAEALPLSTLSSGNSPAEWGRAIHSDAQGQPDVFEKLLGSGSKVLTHVFWAINEGPR